MKPWLRFCLVLVACSATTAHAAPTTRAPGRIQTARKKAASTLAKTGAVFTVGAQLGIVPNAVGELGIHISPKDGTQKRKVSAFVSGEVQAPVLAFGATYSHNKALRGFERQVGPVGRGNGVYGDRIGVTVVPQTLILFASRSGGLGARVTMFPFLPISGPLRLLARWNFSFYITNPVLAPAAIKLLNFSDKVVAKLKAPALRAWERAWNSDKMLALREKLVPLQEKLAPLRAKIAARAAKPS